MGLPPDCLTRVGLAVPARRVEARRSRIFAARCPSEPHRNEPKAPQSLAQPLLFWDAPTQRLRLWNLLAYRLRLMRSDNYTAADPIRHFTVDALPVKIFAHRPALAQYAANEVHAYLHQTLAAQGRAAAILATGNSQIEFLQKLVALPGIDWKKVTLFHMDEYLGITADHKASFRRYLRERVETLVKPGAFHYIQGDAPLPLDEVERYTALLNAQPIDLCCMGVGENGHLAFNDPPVANFRDKHLIKLVQLDDDCKMQQVREGHFPSIEAVNPYAYTLTIPALFSARKVVCIAPESRKAKAIKAALLGEVTTACPASALRTQSQAVLLLDKDSANLL